MVTSHRDTKFCCRLVGRSARARVRHTGNELQLAGGGTCTIGGHIFDQEASQFDIYRRIGIPIVSSMTKGSGTSVHLVASGGAPADRIRSLVGVAEEADEERGLLIRIGDYLMKRAASGGSVLVGGVTFNRSTVDDILPGGDGVEFRDSSVQQVCGKESVLMRNCGTVNDFYEAVASVQRLGFDHKPGDAAFLVVFAGTRGPSILYAHGTADFPRAAGRIPESCPLRVLLHVDVECSTDFAAAQVATGGAAAPCSIIVTPDKEESPTKTSPPKRSALAVIRIPSSPPGREPSPEAAAEEAELIDATEYLVAEDDGGGMEDCSSLNPESDRESFASAMSFEDEKKLALDDDGDEGSADGDVRQKYTALRAKCKTLVRASEHAKEQWERTHRKLEEMCNKHQDAVHKNIALLTRLDETRRQLKEEREASSLRSESSATDEELQRLQHKIETQERMLEHYKTACRQRNDDGDAIVNVLEKICDDNSRLLQTNARLVRKVDEYKKRLGSNTS